jgi:carboxyl-terminal processing protease
MKTGEKVKRMVAKRSWTIWLIIASLFITFMLAPQFAIAESSGSTVQEIEEIYELLRENHLSGIGGEQLIHEAIRGMISSLNDPYTQYFSPQEWQNFINSLNQEFVGVGIVIDEKNGQFIVNRVIANAPADQAGLQAGDIIVAVDGKPVKGKTIQELSQMIIGEEGTPVTLKMKRGNTTKEYKIVRAKIKIPVVDTKSLDDQVGYIQLSSFSSDADELFIEKKKELESQGIRSLIIDLRGNGGGLLDTAYNIGAQFIDEGLLMKTRNRHGVIQDLEILNGSKVDYPVIVLVDQNSASASEVLAGALQDHNIATIVGSKSFGKGTVQQSVPLSSGGVLKLTIEEYFTPKGHQVHKVGITPTIEAKGDLEGLVYALSHLTGKISIQEKGKRTIVGGLEWNASLPYMKDGKEIWLSSRLAAAVLGLEVSWDAKQKTIAFKAPKGTNKTSIAIQSGMTKMSNGTTYIKASALMKLHNQLKISTNTNGLNIEYSSK